jgi:ferredoxin
VSLFNSIVPGWGIVKGMALTLRRFFEPKATVMYPEMPPDVATKFRGRLQLLYDEYGALKCETCFQCAQACPIECIDMGGMDTKGRFHVHWGPPETYGERREESAMRRSGRTVPDQAYEHFAPFDLTTIDEILDGYDHNPKHMLQILEATQAAFGYLPVAAIKRISERTGAWYAIVYGTATFYSHLRFEPPTAAGGPVGVAARRPTDDGYLASLGASLAGSADAKAKATGRSAAKAGPARPAKQGRVQ